jgi:L-aspartate oxidase
MKTSASHASSDFLVLGSGIAGLAFALKAAESGRSVTLLTKRALKEANTAYAQGGIASVLDSDDSFLSHIQDTLESGAGLCKPEVVEAVVKEGPGAIAQLLRWGVRFSKQGRGRKSHFDLTREGGHSARRILHMADLTGHEIERAMAEKVSRSPKIHVHEWHHGVDLILKRGEVFGAFALDVKSGKVKSFLAKATILATGGASKAYLYTTNPDVATGDGLAMAYRAGARIANMEFFQFHPTCLFHPQARRFLISEAVRGEGGILKDLHGHPFMARFHPLKDLAPRDVVARAIDSVMKESGHDHVMLDITHKNAAWIKKRFPHLYKTCLRFGVDMTKERIPVVPAAHFMCGGIQTNLDGESSLGRLYAIGEVACTGLHGANRLASNSLLEGLVMAERAERSLRGRLEAMPAWFKAPKWKTGGAVDSNEAVVVTQNWDEIRRLMWNYVGIFRTNKRLERAARRIKALQKEIHQYYWDFLVTADLLELRNIATVAELVISSARKRKESRGLHYNMDYPARDDAHWLKDTVLRQP